MSTELKTNESEKKWYQQPLGVGVLLWLFFPVGLYFMWKEKVWASKTRIIITSVICLFIIVGLAGKNDNGEDKEQVKMVSDKIFTTHILEIGAYQEEEVERIGRKVYKIAKENIGAKKMELTLKMDKSAMEDKYGNKGEGIFEFPDKMKFDGLDEIRKYADADKYLGNDAVYLAFAYKLQSVLQNVDAERFFKRLENRNY
jgi:hypothetical protein